MRLSLTMLALLPLLGALPGKAEVPFTVEQASRGERMYFRDCAHCHGQELWDGAASPLVGSDFRVIWSNEGKTLYDLFDVTRSTMPVAAEGTLSPQEMADLLAFILDRNGYPSGGELLPTEPDALRSIQLPASPELTAPASRAGGSGKE